MKRRAFISRAGLTIAGAALATPALAQGKVEWRMATAWPRAAADLMGGAERMAQRVGQMSDGRLSVKVLAAGELVPEGQIFDAVSQGMAELGHDIAHDHLTKTVGCAFFASVPFGLTAEETSAWIVHGDGQVLWDELYAAFNLKPFIAGNLGPRPFGWFRREIKSSAELKGLKIRMPGWGGRMLAGLGANPVNTPMAEIVGALKSGAIDAASWSGLNGDLALGLAEATRICYLPGVQAPGTALELVANKQKWDSLAADLKAILRAAAQAGHDDIQAEQTMLSSNALQLLKAGQRVRFLRLSNEFLAGLGEAANALLVQERDKADPTTKRIFASYLKARGRLAPYERALAEAYSAARAANAKYPA